MLGTWHRRLSRVRLLFFRVPMDLRHLSAIWRAIATLAEIGQASLVGRIPEGEIMLCGTVTARSTRKRLSEGKLDNAFINIRVRPRNRQSFSLQ
jgi:hypothetical protein